MAGHPQPLLLSADGAVRERIGKGAYPLGIRPNLTWTVETGRIEPGGALVLHSDGLSEGRSPAGEEFGDARIEALLRQFAPYDAQAEADAIFGSLRTFRGRVLPDDDVSVAVIRRILSLTRSALDGPAFADPEPAWQGLTYLELPAIRAG